MMSPWMSDTVGPSVRRLACWQLSTVKEITTSNVDTVRLPAGRRTGKRNRCGLTLLLVIVCLIFVTAMMGSMLRQVHISHRYQRQLERRQQAKALAESAMERAVFALRRDKTYLGEVWTITADELGTNHDGKVSINIGGTENQTEISVEAIYPLATTLQARVRKRITTAD